MVETEKLQSDILNDDSAKCVLSITQFNQHTPMIPVGTKAPDFSLLDQHAKTVSLSDFKGKKVLLVFYPGDNTPVCTAQLCSYRDNFSAFEEAGVQILGISTDDAASKKNFAEKYQFPFPILSDKAKAVSKQYDALSFFGVSQRAYVLIDETGVVSYAHSELLPIVYRSVNELLSQVQSVSK